MFRFLWQHPLWNLPNLLTVLRVAAIPFLGLVLSWDGNPPGAEADTFIYSPGRVATLLLILAGITDLLDGYYARRWKLESLLGKFLDPVADKLLLLVSLVMCQKLGRIEPWLVIVLLSREFLITALRGVAVGEGIVIAAGQSGKWKTFLQLVGLGFIMWYGSAFGFSAHTIGVWILYAALVISVVSGVGYLIDFKRAIEAKRAATAER